MHSLIGLKDNHVYKKDVDDQFRDIFNSNQALTPDGGDLNRLRNEACYLMMNIHQKYLLFRVNNDHIQDFIDPFQINSDQIVNNASNCSSQLMSDDLSHNDDDSSCLPEDDDCSEIIVDDEQSNHHDTVGNTSTNHVNHVKYDVENTSMNHVDHVGDNICVRATSNFSIRDASVLEDTNKLLSPRDVIKYRLRNISEKPNPHQLLNFLIQAHLTRCP